MLTKLYYMDGDFRIVVTAPPLVQERSCKCVVYQRSRSLYTLPLRTVSSGSMWRMEWVAVFFSIRPECFGFSADSFTPFSQMMCLSRFHMKPWHWPWILVYVPLGRDEKEKQWDYQTLAFGLLYRHTHTHTLTAQGVGRSIGGRKQRASLMQRLAGAFDVEPSHSLLAFLFHTHTHTHACAHSHTHTFLYRSVSCKNTLF